MLQERIPITVGWIDLAAQRVHRGATEVKLSTREVLLLRVLAAKPGEVVTYDELIRKVWKSQSNTNAARQAIKRLRPKIEKDPKHPDHLISDFGNGLALIPLSAQEAMASVSSPVPTNLGARSTPIIGVEDRVVDLIERLKKPSRWVTLTGTGGIGKTHLAQEAGRRVAEEGVFRGGVWFYDASSDTSIESLVTGLARCLKISAPNMTDRGHGCSTFANALISRPRTLVIVDNLEQVAHDAQEALSIWFRLLPAFSWLATSRTVLGGRAEQVVPIAPIPPEPCMTLYTSIAGTPEDETHVRRVLSTLDGLPLAVQCLASQVLTLGESEALASWPENPARHPGGTLHGVFQWSWTLLTDDERSALQQISAFDAPLSIEAVEGIVVVNDTFVEDLVQALLHKSMVVTRTSDQFTTLMPVREFVRQQPFAEYEALHNRHSRWFAEWSEHITTRLNDVADTLSTSEVLSNGHHLIQVLNRFADTHDPLAVKLLLTIPMLHDQDADAVLLNLCQHLWDHDRLSPHDQINVALRMAGTSRRRGDMDAMARWLNALDARIDDHTPIVQKARFAIVTMQFLIASNRLTEVKEVYAAAINEPNIPILYQYMLTRNRARIARGQEYQDWLGRADQLLGENWGAQKVEVCFYQGSVLVERGQAEQGRRFLEPAEFHALRCGHSLALNEIRMSLASLDALEGQWASARARMNKVYQTAATRSSVPFHIRVCLYSCAIALMEQKTDAFQDWYKKMRQYMDQIEPSPANAEALAFGALVQLQNGETEAGRMYWERLVPNLMTHWAVDKDFCETVWTHFETAFFSEQTDALEAARTFANSPPQYREDDTYFFLYLFWLRRRVQTR